MTRWAVELLGSEFDLDDWKAALFPPFEPIVEIADLPRTDGSADRVYLLKTRVFDGCTKPNEVRELAIPTVRKLGALMAVYKNTGKVRLSAVVEMNEAGQYHRHNMVQVNVAEMDDRVSARAVTGGG
jgi:hypothetical protein